MIEILDLPYAPAWATTDVAACDVIHWRANAAPMTCMADGCDERATWHALYRFGFIAWRPVGEYRCDEHKPWAGR